MDKRRTKQPLPKIQGGGLSAELLDLIYPVGSIYLSVASTNPASVFGGTWEQIQDRFLLAAGSTYTAGATGGEASHQLTASELPSHRHKLLGESHTFSWGSDIETTVFPTYNGSPLPAKAGKITGNGIYTLHHTWNYTDTTTGDAAHNNLPPYLVVYVWKRTA